VIIESIELRHVGPFVGSAQAGPLDAGLNILAAHNEEGKTTLVRAAARAMFDRHTCRSDEIKTLQPVGTDLAPSIAIVFQQNGTTFRIEKTFVNAVRSNLSQMVNGKWELKAEGDDADNRLQTLLQSDQPGRGATKPEHWGLFQYLWARQGEPVTWPAWQGEAGKLVRSQLVKVELDPLIEKLKMALGDTYYEIFTESGRPKKGGPLEVATTELERLQTEVNALHQKARNLDEAQGRFQTLGEALAVLENEAREKRSQADAIAVAAKEAELLLGELTAKQVDFTRAQERLHTVENDISELARLQHAIKEIESAIGEKSEVVSKLDGAIIQLAAEQSQLEETFQGQQNRKDSLQSQLERVENLLKWRQALDDAAGLEKQLKQVKKKQSELDHLEERKSKLPALTPQRLTRLQELEQAVRELTAQIEVIGISVEVTPDKAKKVTVTESGKTRAITIKGGKTETIKTGQSIELALETWGRVRVRSGATELKELQAQRDENARDLRGGLSELGVKTVAEAASLLETRKDLEKDIREATRAVSTLLGEFENLKELEAAVNEGTTLARNLETSLRPVSKEKQLAVTELQANEEKLKVEVRKADHQAQQTSKDAKAVLGKLTDQRTMRGEADSALNVLKERLANTNKQISQIQSRYPDGLPSAKTKAQKDFTEAEARVAATQAKLPPEAEKLPERNRRAARAAEEAAQKLQETKTERDKSAGNLEALGAEGIYSRETELLEKMATKEAELLAALRKGWAARLLHDLIERRKQTATRAVLTPLQDQLSSTFGELTGRPSRKVFLDETLQIRGIGRSEQEILPFDLLSQGAKEQLLLALRLAVATAVSNDDRQLLILDDVLVNTDPVRQERVLDLLQNAAQRLQILILTCHADRYRGLGHMVQVQRTEAPRA
jgi:DNA repair exonuclease SbcCD ATPase subunit